MAMECQNFLGRVNGGIMTKSPNLPDVVGEIYKLLDPLDSTDRQKVIKSAMTLLGEITSVGGVATNNHEIRNEDEVAKFGSKAARWLSQNGITISAIDEIFHKDGEKVEVIVGDVPGQGKKTKTQNCYLISGVRALLESDEPKFFEADAVFLCKHMGCYDQANHAKTRSDFGNIIAGSKTNGYTLPAPGLRAAAELIKTMINIG
jgi:hypothetical protein